MMPRSSTATQIQSWSSSGTQILQRSWSSAGGLQSLSHLILNTLLTLSSRKHTFLTCSLERNAMQVSAGQICSGMTRLTSRALISWGVIDVVLHKMSWRDAWTWYWLTETWKRLSALCIKLWAICCMVTWIWHCSHSLEDRVRASMLQITTYCSGKEDDEARSECDDWTWWSDIIHYHCRGQGE